MRRAILYLWRLRRILGLILLRNKVKKADAVVLEGVSAVCFLRLIFYLEGVRLYEAHGIMACSWKYGV